MQLKETGQTILSQIFDLTLQLSNEQFSAELDILNGNTIGKHVRHILEFFGLLVSGAADGVINYDNRKHDPRFETDTSAVLHRIEELHQLIDAVTLGDDLFLEVSYAQSNADTIKIKSSLDRELAYNIEHAIHHMAIIKIAVQTIFPSIKLAENFGVAYSTIRYQKST
jgi:uncharacterized damage-inducible protein DinB